MKGTFVCESAIYESFLASNMLNVRNDVHDNEIYFSTLTVPYRPTPLKKLLSKLSIVEGTVDTIALLRVLSILS